MKFEIGVGMTQPRLRIAGATMMLTRTTSDRRFLLRPSPIVNHVFGYCLFAAAEKMEVLVHSVTVLSTHVHLVVTVPQEQLSEFSAWLNRHVALCLLELYRKEYPNETLENIWSSSKPHELILKNKASILKEMQYAYTNPVKDLLVHDYRDWPGLCSRPADMLREGKQYTRPKLYFAEESRAPEKVFGKFTIPPAFEDEDPEDFVRTLEALVNEEQERLRVENQGKKYLGAKAAMRVHPLESPKNQRSRKQVTPIVAAGDDAQELREAKKAVLWFRRAYRAAWLLFKETGSAVFPPGTLKMHHHYQQSREVENGCFDWCVRMRAPA
jgi:REP element-mobilizing transposase RayT